MTPGFQAATVPTGSPMAEFIAENPQDSEISRDPFNSRKRYATRPPTTIVWSKTNGRNDSANGS
jgi:hypothetical protein